MIISKLPNVGTTIFSTMSALAAEHQAVNLAQGFPDFLPDEKLMALVSHYMAKGFNQYAPMLGVKELRTAISRLIQECYGATLDPDTEVTVTVGATEAVFVAINAFVRQGDEVIVIEPAYDLYAPAIALAGGLMRTHATHAPDYRVDWEALARLVNERTRMIILNTPHNPTGSIMTQDDWTAVEELVAGRDILILSDEAYEHLVFDGEQHHSAWSMPNLRERVIVTSSFGKTFHCTGWRVGYVAADEALMKEFRKVHQYCTFSVSTPFQYALAEYMASPDAYSGVSLMYETKRNYFRNALSMSSFKLLPCKGSFFQLVDYSDISPDEDDMSFARRLVIEHGVAAVPLSPFYSNGTDGRIIRLCFAKQDSTLEEAAVRLLLV